MPLLTDRDDLFQRVLLDPAKRLKRPRLLVVSGYASPEMVMFHAAKLRDSGISASIDLILGMAGHDGIRPADHDLYVRLMGQAPSGISFTCRYALPPHRVHAKVYCWQDEAGVASSAFCGSANYSVTGFQKTGSENEQREVAADADPGEAQGFFEQVSKNACKCTSEAAARACVVRWVDAGVARPHEDSALASVTLSLLAAGTGETHRRAGLNWGQREGRDRNQAYIPVPSKHYEFFPRFGERFTVLTDDGKAFIMVRVQEQGKALETPQDNAALGKYLRRRIGVASGEFVTRGHLERYGRTGVTFRKMDDDTYLLDFSRDPDEA